MNPEMMLAQLAPLREPPAVNWWPLAAGWWILMVLGLLALGFLAHWYRRRRRHRHYRRIALAELDRLRQQGAATDELNRLLKAAALRAYSEKKIAPLHGQHWLYFLCDTCEAVTVEKLSELEDCYRAHPASASDNLFDAAEKWIRHHEATRA